MSEHSIITFGYGPNGSVYRILTMGYNIGVSEKTGFVFPVDANITKDISMVFEINRTASVEVVR